MTKKRIIEILKSFEQRDFKKGGVSIAPEMYGAIADAIIKENPISKNGVLTEGSERGNNKIVTTPKPSIMSAPQKNKKW